MLDKKVKLDDGFGHKAAIVDNSQVVPSDGEQLLQQILHENKVITGTFLCVCVCYSCVTVVYRSLDWSPKEMTAVSRGGGGGGGDMRVRSHLYPSFEGSTYHSLLLFSLLCSIVSVF